MTYLILGLLIFLGVHSVRMVAEGWRGQTMAKMGENAYKGIFSLLSAVGLGLIIWGFGLARQAPVMVWLPPAGMRHVTGVLVLVAFVLVTAAYVPGNAIKARLHHPMVLGVKSWAFAHLLSNGSWAGIVLFGSFLAWSVVLFAACRRRDREQHTQYPPGRTAPTAVTALVGVGAWALFAFVLHGMLIGIRPLG